MAAVAALPPRRGTEGPKRRQRGAGCSSIGRAEVVHVVDVEVADGRRDRGIGLEAGGGEGVGPVAAAGRVRRRLERRRYQPAAGEVLRVDLGGQTPIVSELVHTSAQHHTDTSFNTRYLVDSAGLV